MCLEASKNSYTKNAGIVHFFDGEATSTFIIKRMGKTVYEFYYGRNKITNTANIPLLDKVTYYLVITFFYILYLLLVFLDSCVPGLHFY